jgi:cellulose synthase/poly-beta-1,6-N-acetylglucosamine synthase-like glycosyltransferase
MNLKWRDEKSSSRHIGNRLKSFPSKYITSDKIGFSIIFVLWFLMFYYTVAPYFWTRAIPVNRNLDLSFITTPLVAASIINSAIWVSIYIIFHIVRKKVIDYQITIMKKNSMDKEKYQPLVSIIIPSRDEENVIRQTVLNCLEQTYKNIQVIIVCHNCKDRTFEEAKLSDKRVKALELKTVQAGKGIALNYGIDNSDGEYILVLDSDGRLDKEFVANCLPFFKEGYAAVQGKIDASNRDYNLLSRLLALEGDLFSFPFMAVRSFLSRRTPLGGTGFIINKEILIKAGKFSNSLIDDFELSFRLYKQGYEIVFAPLSVVSDEKPPKIDIMMKQRARWLKGHIDLLKHNIAEPSDVIGMIYWLSPAFSACGLVSVAIASFSVIFYLGFGYYPYRFAHVPFLTWIILTTSINALYVTLLRYDTKINNFRHFLYSLFLTPFSTYWYVVLVKSFFVKSWSTTKTLHGFRTVS